MDTVDRIRKINEGRAEQQASNSRYEESIRQSVQTQETIIKSIQTLVQYLDNRTSKTAVVNQLKDIGTPDVAKVVTAIEGLHSTLKDRKDSKDTEAKIAELKDVMAQVLEQAKQIPKDQMELPKQKFIDYTSQFDALAVALESVNSSIQNIETNVEVPSLEIPPAQVEVQAPDLKPLSKDIKAVEKAVKAIVIPKTKFDNTKVEKELKAQTKLLKDIREETGKGGGSGGATGSPDFIAGRDFDYMAVANTSATVDTLTYKKGGASGEVKRTLAITFAAGAEKISASITSLDYS